MLLSCRGRGPERPVADLRAATGKVNTAANPPAMAGGQNFGNRRSRRRLVTATGRPLKKAATHGPSFRSVCSCSNLRALPSDAAMYRGALSSERSVTPAEVIGRTSTIRPTRRSNMPCIGKSVRSVRANSMRTSDRSFTSPKEALPSRMGPGLAETTLKGRTLKGVVVLERGGASGLGTSTAPSEGAPFPPSPSLTCEGAHTLLITF